MSTPKPGTPTQVAHPWRAAVRTIVAYLVVIVPALIVAIPVIADQLGPYLPEAWAAWLLAAATFLATLVGLATRLMALPQVQAVLETAGLGTGVHVEGHGRRADRDGVMDGRDTPRGERDADA